MSCRLLFILALSLPLIGFAAPADAQLEENKFGLREDLGGDFGGDFGNLLGNKPAASGKDITLESFIVPGSNMKPARLVVRAVMGDHWHVYSLTQPKGGPPATKITVEKSDNYEFIEGFKSLEPPEVRTLDDLWKDLPIEEHYEEVTWIAPIKIAEGVDPESIVIKGELTEGQVCHDEEGCKPFSFLETKFTARLGTPEQIASVPEEVASTPVVAETENPAIDVFVMPQVVQPGDTAKLVIRVAPQPSWHVYEWADKIAKGMAYSPTLIALTETSGLSAGKPLANAKVIAKNDVRYYDGPTEFTINLSIPKTAEAGEYPLEGLLGYQVCTDLACMPPRGVAFSGTLQVGSSTITGAAPLNIAKSDYGAAKTALASASEAKPTLRLDATALNPTESVEATSIGMALLFALLGGLILNVMPCVLPVIGLKVLSFFDQAGQNRKRAFFLNFSYSMGMLFVFFVLAFLGVGLSQMFTEHWFGIIMASVVFAMALSMMGLWELQIPGFIGAGKMQNVAEKEGGTGAFFKGILTTLLAIPCGAPLLSPALKFVDQQVRAGTSYYAFPVFLTIGLGMAMPYLIVGAFPELLRFMPKPGAWMETFKKSMGYLMLGAVVWILWFLPIQDILPTVAFLFGLWLACWIIGRLPLTASAGKSLKTWGAATAVVAGTGAIAAFVLHPAMEAKLGRAVSASVLDGASDEAILQRAVALRDDNESKSPLRSLLAGAPIDDSATSHSDELAAQNGHLPWKPFTRASFDRLVAEEKTILVDFTADWCATCKVLERTVLNTEPVRELVAGNDVIAMQADWTNGAPEVTAMLDLLGGRQVPVIAIFPAGDPNHPIIFRGGYTQGGIVEALRKAGPSVEIARQDDGQRTAMRQTSP